MCVCEVLTSKINPVCVCVYLLHAILTIVKVSMLIYQSQYIKAFWQKCTFQTHLDYLNLMSLSCVFNNPSVLIARGFKMLHGCDTNKTNLTLKKKRKEKSAAEKRPSEDFLIPVTPWVLLTQQMSGIFPPSRILFPPSSERKKKHTKKKNTQSSRNGLSSRLLSHVLPVSRYQSLSLADRSLPWQPTLCDSSKNQGFPSAPSTRGTLESRPHMPRDIIACECRMWRHASLRPSPSLVSSRRRDATGVAAAAAAGRMRRNALWD